jgi:hypothetical protein
MHEVEEYFSVYMKNNNIEFLYSDSDERFYEEINQQGLTESKALLILEQHLFEC